MTAGGRALVVANASDADAGYVGDRLVEHGFQLDVVLRDGEPRHPPTVAPEDRPDVLVLLGSEWSVATPHDPQARDVEASLVRSALERDVPVLAICYGAQVLAHALGGEVRRAERPEIGLVQVETHDPSLVAPGPWTAFHVDLLVPPAGARVLARNACGTQAFLVPGALAVQFHPEVRPEVLDDWAGRFPELLEAVGVSRSDLLAAATGRVEESRQAAHLLVDTFLERVAGGTVGQRVEVSTSPNATE